MKNLKFEYRITLAYMFIGGLWILFSDRLLHFFLIDNLDLEMKFQTYKGWFYILVTALLFFLFVKKHLERLRDTEAELKNHKDNLQELVNEKTVDLGELNQKLNSTNQELLQKSNLITRQNRELTETLDSLKKTQSKLIQTDKMASLGTFTAGVAHEINNPLNFIMGAYNGLEDYFNEYGSKDQQVTDFLLTSIKTGIERATGIVHGLNEFSRDNKDFNEDCDIHAILDNCLMMLHNQTDVRIEIIKKYSDQGIVITGNIGKLHQAFINILNNSIQAIKDKGRIEIVTEKNERNVTVQILDTGYGINGKDIKKIIEPFFTTKAPGEGTGLGLSITYSIIQDHKGTISFESEVGKWTKAFIKFTVK